MKSVIIYASTHHGNTKKVVDAIAGKFDTVEIVDATKVREKNLKDYDLIGFASGIFFAKFAEPVLNFARVNLPMNKNVFFIATAGNTNKGNFKSIENVVCEKKSVILGRFQCKGYDTYGPFKLIGGLNKDRPNDDDLKDAVRYYESLLE